VTTRRQGSPAPSPKASSTAASKASSKDAVDVSGTHDAKHHTKDLPRRVVPKLLGAEGGEKEEKRGKKTLECQKKIQ
jgi:hypothetical protein